MRKISNAYSGTRAYCYTTFTFQERKRGYYCRKETACDLAYLFYNPILTFRKPLLTLTFHRKASSLDSVAGLQKIILEHNIQMKAMETILATRCMPQHMNHTRTQIASYDCLHFLLRCLVQNTVTLTNRRNVRNVWPTSVPKN